MSLTVNNVTFSYNKKAEPVLKAFSAEFHSGRITALTGENGCGKTTLAKLIMGILKPYEGRIMLAEDGQERKEDGSRETDLSDLSLAETGRKIGYVMQNPARQIFSTSVSEEIRYGLKNMGLNEDETNYRAAEFLRYFDIEKYADTFPFFLSQGEKQRLVLASVLAMEPAWLILDEPTASLDIKRKTLLGNYLTKIRKEKNCGIIVITHDRDFAKKYTDSEVRMGDRDV